MKKQIIQVLDFELNSANHAIEFAKALAKHIDVFVNDAFGTAHRAHASTAGVASFIPIKVSGKLS